MVMFVVLQYTAMFDGEVTDLLESIASKQKTLLPRSSTPGDHSMVYDDPCAPDSMAPAGPLKCKWDLK